MNSKDDVCHSTVATPNSPQVFLHRCLSLLLVSPLWDIKTQCFIFSLLQIYYFWQLSHRRGSRDVCVCESCVYH